MNQIFFPPDVEKDTDDDKIENVVKEIGSLLNGEGLNVLINNAGRNSKNEGKLSKDVLTKDFSTNVFAPLLLTKVTVMTVISCYCELL